VQPGTRHADDDVARGDVSSVDDAGTLHDPDGEAREIVLAARVEAGQLCRLAAEKRAQPASSQPRAMPSTTAAASSVSSLPVAK
jgi:hypothetical protein